MSSEEEEKPVVGFDRGVEYLDMKKILVKDYGRLCREYEPENKKVVRLLCYCIISMIQLRNGSRISEACEAFRKFMKLGLDSKVTVKIAKSKSIKYKKDTKEKFTTKARFREMIYPKPWVKREIPCLDDIKNFLREYEGNLKKRVLDYLLRHHNCNTHSLRYAFINYMLYDQKKEMALIAKFVGHSDISQLVRYTQLKETNKLFDLDI